MTDGTREPESGTRPAAPTDGGVGFAALSSQPVEPGVAPGGLDPVTGRPMGVTDPVTGRPIEAPPIDAPAVGWTPPPPPASSRSGRGGLIRNVAILAVIGAVVIGAIVFRDRLSGAAGDLVVGDCFDEPNTTTEVQDVQHHPCAEAHDGEVLFVGDVSSSSYPGDAAFDEFVKAQCVPAFNSYLGRDYATDTEYDLGFFYPTEDSWSNSDHEVTCYVYRIDEQKMTSSLKKGG